MSLTNPVPARPWRDDLQGLRAVAILLVATYHVWSDRISGGVDVFLMLSGFFVGGSLWRRFVAGQPPRATEYLARHARRLLPTAITVLAATAVGAVLVLPRIEWESGAQQTFASLFYVENWYLASTGQAYGAADVTTSPWQHFWSMSVQGQFFLLTPLIFAAVWLVVRRKSDATVRVTFLWTLIGLTGISFAYAVWLVQIDQTVAYYSTPARIWEFLLGTLLAVLLAKWTPSGRLWGLASWAGLALLLATGLLVDGGTTFPGLLALVPLAAAAAIVIGGASPTGTGASRLLAVPWVAGLGKYAYAFYLWHWPILVLITAMRGRESGWKVGAVVLAVSAMLAFLTYHLIENPLNERSVRYSSGVHVIPFAAVVSFSLVVALGSAGWLGHVAIQEARAKASFSTHPGALALTSPGEYGSVPKADPIPAIEVIRGDFSKVSKDGCVTKQADRELIDCSYVDGNGLRVALFGGSHSVQWFEVAEHLAEKHDWTLVPVLKEACQPTMPEDARSDECGDWLTDAYATLGDGDFDLIITTATRPGGGADEIPETYRSMLSQLGSHSTVLGLRDNPLFPVDMPECYSEDGECDFPLYSRIWRDSPLEGLNIPGVITADLNDLICPNDLCQPVVGNRFVFSDRQHVSTTYVLSMVEVAAERWEQALVGAGFAPSL